jgi:hypothetical protein
LASESGFFVRRSGRKVPHYVFYGKGADSMQIQGETSINKLILLFVFDKMESALSERTLVDMCATSNDWINYMDCVMMISQLLEDGFICTVETNDDTLYTITPDGRSCLANFYINIPKSVREEIAVFVKNNSAKYRNRQECKSDYYQNKDGTYTVFLRILAPAQPMLELKFVVPDRKTAQNIYKKWELKAADVYAVIYENLVD